MNQKQMNKKRVTIVDIAKKANVSISTASRVFDAKWDGKIKDTTRENVLAVAKELNYFGANALVKGLNGSPTSIIALIVSETSGFFYNDVLNRLIAHLRLAGKQVMVFQTDPSKKEFSKIVAEVHQYCVDGVIVTSPATYDIIESFNFSDLPLVLFNRKALNSNISSIYCDNIVLGKKAAQFLLDQGHRSFAFISGNASRSITNQRLIGFSDCVKHNGGRMEHVLDGDYSYESALNLARTICSSDVPDAVFASEDSMAAAMMDVARYEFNMSIPNDISVMGVDNTSLSRHLAYQLTTMSHPLDDMIESTLEILEKLLISGEKQYERVYDMQLVIRKSVKLNNQL